MAQALTPVGDGLGIVLDPTILARLGIDRETRLEVTTDGQSLVIRPLAEGDAALVDRVTDQVMDIHAETLEKLAR